MNEYTVKSIKAWGQGDMYSVTFEEHNNEPCDMKQIGAAPRVGDTVKGKIEDYVTASGSTRIRFVTAESMKQDELRQLEINTSWAITNALQICTDNTKENIKQHAQMLLDIKKELMQ